MTTADAILEIKDNEEQYRYIRSMTIRVTTGKCKDLEGRYHTCRQHHFADGSILDAILDNDNISFTIPQAVLEERVKKEFQRIFSR